MSHTPLVMTARYQVRPEAIKEFMALAEHDASESLAFELGCRRFEISLDDSTPHTVVLTATFDDRSAFDHHTHMPHYLPYLEGVSAMLETPAEIDLSAADAPAA